MNEAVIFLVLVLLGLCLGSFAGATVWRLRAHQLQRDKDNKEPYDNDEHKKLHKLQTQSLLKDRSQCLHCSYALRWYDLIPVLSWVALGGKCRRCRNPIGVFEPLMEIGLATFLVVSYLLWPYPIDTVPEVARLIIWLLSGVGLIILFAYDAKWFLLPDVVTFVVIALGVGYSVATLLLSTDIAGSLVNIGLSLAILSGLYFVLYVASKGAWIGFGDIKLGIGLALLLADWKLAFFALFAANLIGCILVIPALMTGKIQRSSHIAFGPLLILGTIFAQLAGPIIISTYFPVLF